MPEVALEYLEIAGATETLSELHEYALRQQIFFLHRVFTLLRLTFHAAS